LDRDWTEILRISSTQKFVTTTLEDSDNTRITLKKCSEPNTKLLKIYQALKYKSKPFRIKKFVVPKPEHIKQKPEQFRYFTG
jgi:hypothetical protein